MWFSLGLVCPLMTHKRQMARRYAAPHSEFGLGLERHVTHALADEIS